MPRQFWMQASTGVRLETLKIAAGDGSTQKIMPLLGGCFAIAVSDWTSPYVLGGWLLAVIGSAAYFLHVRKALESVNDQRMAGRWTVRLAGATALITATWSSLGLFAWPGADADGQLILTVFVLGSMAGSAALTGASAQIFLTDFAIYISVLLLPRLIWWDDLSGLYAFVIPMFGGIMFSVGLHTNRAARALLALRDDNTQLITQLECAKADSDIARLRAETANRAKSDFLANMSHELRTPLNAVIGFSEVMRDEIMGPIENSTYKSYAADIHSSGQHLLSLINDILDLSKLEAGKFEIDDEEIDLRDLCEDMRRLLALKASEKSIDLINDVPSGLTLIGDRRALKQIAYNLGSNALKFTPPRGKVRASVGTEADGALALYLEDTGCGIPHEDLESVFEVFGQGRHDIATNRSGTGLGLPIVRSLVRAHGGEVTIRSTVGEGTTVIVTMDPARVRWLLTPEARALA